MLFVCYDNLAKFLLVQLHIDSLVEKLSTQQIHASLEILPKGMDSTYNEAMEPVE